MSPLATFPQAHAKDDGDISGASMHLNGVTDAVFADRAKFVVSVGMDRAVNFYQAPELADYFDEPEMKKARV